MTEPTHDDADLSKLIDPDTRVDLTADGLAGYELGESISADGRRELWLVDIAGLGRVDHDHGAYAPPAHELLGPLIDEALWDRICDTPIRCCLPRRDGQPCRAVVRWPGDHCNWHRTSREAPR
ncbi:hypothetical protein R4227_06045 [Gordonia amicalis]|uniref:hypothetical protein n=1 Tax=Gordonia amicalis TaxID=89053 RepID=UPI002955DB24|nr:hypothetical protein [Gordonia amicalis]MDV7099703.1 hypothetical protein [Gordonia amicalis]